MTNVLLLLFNTMVCVGLPVSLIAAIATGVWYIATHGGPAGIIVAGLAVAATTVAITGVIQGRGESCDDS